MVFFLLFLLVGTVAIVLGILGVLVHGLFSLLIIGALLLLADAVYLGVHSTRRRRRRPLR